MKRRDAVVLGVLSIVISVAIVLPGLCEEARRPVVSSTYADMVDYWIEKGAAKADLLGSGSRHIRTLALRSCLKSVYFTAKKEALVEYLREENVHPNIHRVAYHLNLKFYEAARHKKIYAHVRIERPEADRPEVFLDGLAYLVK